MSSEKVDSYFSATTFVYVVGLFAILVLIAVIGARTPLDNRATAWVEILLLIVLFGVVAGRGITGKWRGILIDNRNRMSLSRLQVLAWSALILSAMITAVLTNVAHGDASPLGIEIPSTLWVLLGISTASAIGSPAIMDSKASRATTAEAGIASRQKDIPAQWADLLTGDEVGRRSETIDVGKLQMFFFTFILLVGYGTAILSMFQTGDPVPSLPPVDDGMNVLLGISHTGYLAAKAPTKPADAPPSQDGDG